MTAKYVDSEWATVLARSSPADRLRPVIPPGRLFSSPYLQPPEVVESETGEPLVECIGCLAFREGVRDTEIAEGGVMGDVCAACRARAQQR